MDDTQHPLISVRLLGLPEAVIDGQPAPLAPDTSLGLLTLLASSAQPPARAELLELLYPEVEQGAARNRLRQALHRLRGRPWGAGLIATPGDVQWRAPSDVRTFRDECSAGRWANALAAHRGTLLEHLRPTALPAFEAWLDQERDDLQQLWVDAALSPAEALDVGGQPEAARPW